MKLKGKHRYNMARILQKAMTKKPRLSELMFMPKKELIDLWKSYIAHCEAEEAMGDCEP